MPVAHERGVSRGHPGATALVVAIFAALGCGPANSVDAPAPAPVMDGAVDSHPTLPPSLVEAPITYDLAPALASHEGAVPRKLGDIKARPRSTTNRRIHTPLAAEPDSFQVRFEGTTNNVPTVHE